MTAPGESRAVSSVGPTEGLAVFPRTHSTSTGADAAARTLYERYGNRIFRYCLQRLYSVEEAEDAAQTAFLYAFVGLRRGVEPEFEVAWLYKIAENVCRTRLRARARRGRFETAGDLFELLDVVPAAEPTSSDQIEALPEILAGMPPSQRRALLLREVQGLSYREIAEQLRTSVSAVETLLFRARRSCARELDRLAQPAGKALSVASVASTFRSLISKYLAWSPGAKVAVLAAAAATGGALVATPRLVDHGGAKPWARSKPRSPVAPAEVAAGSAMKSATALARRAPLERKAPKTRRGTQPSTLAPADAPATVVTDTPSAPTGSTPSTTGAQAPPPQTSDPTTAPPQPTVAPPAVTVPTVPSLPPPPAVELPPPPLPTVPELPPLPSLPPLPPPPPVGLP
jgi:RNA polymerase sigma-70 factor (ECF subfamily)